MKKVFINTTTTQITGQGKVKPKSPFWVFVNTGQSVLIINNNYPLLPGASFGISVDGIAGVFLKDGIEVVSNTEFDVKFYNPAGFDNLAKARGEGHLIETFIEYKTN